MLELAAVADDAFENEGNGEPDASSFAGTESAGTKFKFVMWHYDGENHENQGNWHDVWNYNDYPDEEGVATPIGGQLTVMMRTYDLAALDTLEAVKEAAAEFRRECREILQLDLPDLQEMT